MRFKDKIVKVWLKDTLVYRFYKKTTDSVDYMLFGAITYMLGLCIVSFVFQTLLILLSGLIIGAIVSALAGTYYYKKSAILDQEKTGKEEKQA